MNSKDESESSKFLFGEMTPRFVRQLKGQNDNLYKEYTKLQEKLQKTKDCLGKAQTINTSLQKELSLAKANLKKIVAQKQIIEKESQEVKEYSRKLEQKIAMGSKGQSLGEQNFQLQTKIQDYKQEKQSQSLRIKELEAEVESLSSEIQNLNLICKLKIEDFGLKSSNSDEILYSLATTAQSLTHYKTLSEELQTKQEAFMIKIEELQIIRESNNEELNRLEEENLKLKKQITELVKDNKDVALDRNALLQCLEEMSSQQKQYEMDIEYFNQEFVSYQQQAEGKILGLTKEIELKDQIIQKKTEKNDQKVENFENFEKKLADRESENLALKDSLSKSSEEKEALKKDFENKEKRLKNKLAMCLKELNILVNEKEEIQASLNKALAKCSEKVFIEDRPRQIDETMALLTQAKQKNLDLLKMIS